MLNHPTLVLTKDAARMLEDRFSVWRHKPADPLATFLEQQEEEAATTP